LASIFIAYPETFKRKIAMAGMITIKQRKLQFY